MRPGLQPHGLDHIRDVCASYVGPDKVPGLVALVAHGDDVHTEVLGDLSVGGPPVRRDSLFRIASTTKPLTGALTLALVREGLFGLGDPVERFLPELGGRRVLVRPDGPLAESIPAHRSIVVRDLLTFTFGFGMALEMFTTPGPWPVVAATQELELATIGPPAPDVPPDPDTWIERLGSLPLIAQPGERWLYNTGAQVLGVLAARAAGRPVEEVLRTRLLEPLGMRDTAFWTAETGRLATAYMPTPDGLVLADPPDGAWSRPPRFPDTAAGLVSTADDLLAFARMLLRGGEPVLARDDVAAMASDQLTPAQKARGSLAPDGFARLSWGFCQAVYPDGSFGWDGGFGTSWLVDPRRDLVVIVMTQRMFESPEPPAVHLAIREAAYGALAG